MGESVRMYRLSDEAPADAAADVLFEMGLAASGRDLVEAHKWFNLAALRGHEMARRYRGELAEQMSREELREALARARRVLDLV